MTANRREPAPLVRSPYPDTRVSTHIKTLNARGIVICGSEDKRPSKCAIKCSSLLRECPSSRTTGICVLSCLPSSLRAFGISYEVCGRCVCHLPLVFSDAQSNLSCSVCPTFLFCLFDLYLFLPPACKVLEWTQSQASDKRIKRGRRDLKFNDFATHLKFLRKKSRCQSCRYFSTDKIAALKVLPSARVLLKLLSESRDHGSAA